MSGGIQKNEDAPLLKAKSCWQQSRFHCPAHATHWFKLICRKMKKPFQSSIGGLEAHIFPMYFFPYLGRHPIVQWVLSALQAEYFLVHPACFSYLAESSVKGPAENDVVFLMMEEILTDGFITSGEPLMLLQSHGLSNGSPQVSCYAKLIIWEVGSQFLFWANQVSVYSASKKGSVEPTSASPTLA